MRDAKIVTLYKNKGDKDDCNNYRGIFLQNITDKAFARLYCADFRNWLKEIFVNLSAALGANDQQWL